ncbi:F-box domain, FBD domain, Leucine-rich repeat domain, L domain-like protein [Artemisia annua]|uniref:F-box domain, FBD domain, Leucine-rich repeat domain, L domain-like protein n=1 Tax=Artemisia annua TaxID=35608 RepID=A0A2U1KVI1_ARTAN|nr:F-box domain, FBD domain, Leucine-rich repeat domain, L domain-like protein [Artemisia annua]
MASNLENDVDFISNMPDLVLQLILQSLPNTEEVVRTSILSTRWRYLWTSIPLFPSLNIDCDRVLNPSMTHQRAKKLEDFVSWALANETVDLDSFRLSCAAYFDMPMVWRWVNDAVTRKVKRLDLMVCTRDKDKRNMRAIVLPHCLVTSESLESLRLYIFTIVDALTLLKMCTLLQELCLINCIGYSVLEISHLKLKTLIIHDRSRQRFSIGLVVSCPELVFFECAGLRIRDPFILKKVESLKTAVILPQCEFDRQYFCKIFARISHVESLSLDCSSIRYASDLEGNFPKSFPNLKTLELTTTFETYDMKLLIRILTCSPNLESIHLIIHKVCYGSEYRESDRVETMRILSPCLKRVEFLAFETDKSRLEIAQLLLEHRNALEKMVFSWCNEVDYHEKSTGTLNEVSKFHKASSSVKLVNLLKK